MAMQLSTWSSNGYVKVHRSLCRSGHAGRQKRGDENALINVQRAVPPSVREIDELQKKTMNRDEK